MKCQICKKEYYLKREFLELFSQNNSYICNSCYNKYKIELSYQEFMLENYNCIVVSMFKKRYKIDYRAFTLEYSQIARTLYKKKNYEVLLLDFVDLSYNLELLNMYANLLKSNIIILCYNYIN